MLRQPTLKMAALRPGATSDAPPKNRFPNVAVDGPRNYP
jgi:hypothetical protein